MTRAYVYSSDIWPPLAAAIFLAAVGLYSWRRRSVSAAWPLVVCSLFGALWLLGLAFGAASFTLRNSSQNVNKKSCRHSSQHLFAVMVVAALVVLATVAGCVPPPALSPAAVPPATVPEAPRPTATAAEVAPTTAPPPASRVAAAPAAMVTPAVVPSGFQVYANPAGFAIAYPGNWTAEAEPDSNNGGIHTQALKGPEGEVHLSWGVGFGGACPPGYAAVKAAQGLIQACYAKNADGSESWTQMSHRLPDAGFSGRALTSNAQPAGRDLVLQILSTLTFAPGPAETMDATPVPTYNDPFVYCAAVGTIDAPDARYTGPKTPDVVLPMPVGPGTPSPFPQGSVYWRCMDGQVYSCAVGANIPCWSKAGTATTPNSGMQEFCKQQPNADFIPAVAAGRETIYEWRCKSGVPAMGKQALQVDAQGFVAEYWQPVPQPGAAPPGATIGNPASQNCEKQGGTLRIETRPGGGQFGVCSFADNRQCEEWALMRGDCPAGGVKVTGYNTPAARFCAITGGVYASTANSGQADEQGTCTLKDGAQCDAGAYFSGACSPSVGS